MPPADPAARRQGFPLSVVLVLGAAGLAAAWALVFLGLWLQSLGSHRGWWDLPAEDESGVALAFGSTLAAAAALLAWAAVHRCRRTFGYSRPATALIAVEGLVGAMALTLALSI